MSSSPKNSPKEATTATQLPWTPDDDAGWDDSYDVDDEDLGLGSLDEKEEDKNEDDPLIILNSDDDDANDDEVDDGDGIVPDEAARTTPASSEISHVNSVNDNDNAAPIRNILSTISSPYTNIGSRTPLRQENRTPLSVSTPLELYDGEDNFEETVRKRNRVSNMKTIKRRKCFDSD
jgi:hypothetical protein